MQDLIHIIKNANDRYDGDMIHYFNVVMKCPNAYLPYHNVRHMLHVFWESYDAGIETGLGRRELRNLLIAAIMHDYGHIGSGKDDQINIDNAITGLKDNILDQDKEWFIEIKEMIDATKFPYDDRQFTKNALLLRDADQSQTFSVTWIQSILYGLGKEMNMSYEQMLRIQRPFLENLKFNSSWAINKFQPLLEQRLKDVDRMLSLLEQ